MYDALQRNDTAQNQGVAYNNYQDFFLAPNTSLSAQTPTISSSQPRASHLSAQSALHLVACTLTQILLYFTV